MAAKMLKDVAVKTIVKLNEGGQPAEFVVIHQGSPGSAYYGFEDTTLILRNDIKGNHVWDSGNDPRYGNSDANSWLNNTSNGYLSLLDPDIRNLIPNVKIPYVASRGSYSVSSGANGLSVKAFLLSMKEVNLSPSQTPSIGNVLSYFSNANNSTRVAKLNGSASRWGSRTPNNSEAGGDIGGDGGFRYVYSVNASGSATSSECRESYGMRPALPMPNTLYVLDDGTIPINVPPTAPGSITAENVIGNQQATITLTAATDPRRLCGVLHLRAPGGRRRMDRICYVQRSDPDRPCRRQLDHRGLSGKGNRQSGAFRPLCHQPDLHGGAQFAPPPPPAPSRQTM